MPSKKIDGSYLTEECGPRQEKCGQGPRTRARQRARYHFEGCSRQTAGTGRIRPFRILDDRGARSEETARRIPGQRGPPRRSQARRSTGAKPGAPAPGRRRPRPASSRARSRRPSRSRPPPPEAPRDRRRPPAPEAPAQPRHPCRGPARRGSAPRTASGRRRQAGRAAPGQQPVLLPAGHARRHASGGAPRPGAPVRPRRRRCPRPGGPARVARVRATTRSPRSRACAPARRVRGGAPALPVARVRAVPVRPGGAGRRCRWPASGRSASGRCRCRRPASGRSPSEPGHDAQPHRASGSRPAQAVRVPRARGRHVRAVPRVPVADRGGGGGFGKGGGAAAAAAAPRVPSARAAPAAASSASPSARSARNWSR